MFFHIIRLYIYASLEGDIFMQTLEISELRPDMIVAADIVTKRGQTIAKAGSKLTAPLIARLSFYRVDTVSVEEEATPEPVPEPKPTPVKEKPVINETISYTNRLKAEPEYQEFQVNYSIALNELEDMFIDIIEFKGSNFDQERILTKFAPLYHSKTSLDILTLLQTMGGSEDTVYAHSINVSLVSRAIGKWLKLPKQELDDLTMAGLLHDLGKANVPPEVLNKAGKLTDEEFAMIKNHALDGRRMLKEVPGMDPRYLNAASQHHERSDGTGYPRQLTDDEIDDFAAIIAIADVYDAMTASRSYRSAMCPFQVIEAFERDGLSKYRTKFILTFLEHIAMAHQNSLVVLSNGSRGRVVYINQSTLSKPIVELSDDTMLDLSRQSELHITSIL